MNTQDKVINDLAIQLANKTIECANYKALYEEAQEQLATLEQNGKLGIWKWTEPKQEKPSNELDTQPVQ